MKWQRVKYQPNTPLGANGQKVTASKAHTELSKQAAKEGMVLLKNENSLLPYFIIRTCVTSMKEAWLQA